MQLFTVSLTCFSSRQHAIGSRSIPSPHLHRRAVEVFKKCKHSCNCNCNCNYSSSNCATSAKSIGVHVSGLVWSCFVLTRKCDEADEGLARRADQQEAPLWHATLFAKAAAAVVASTVKYHQQARSKFLFLEKVIGSCLAFIFDKLSINLKHN